MEHELLRHKKLRLDPRINRFLCGHTVVFDKAESRKRSGSQNTHPRHGFRTEVSGTGADEDHFGVPHLAAEITQVAAMPSYAAMEKIIAALS